MRYNFILPLDTFKSNYETFRFHKGMIYSVSHVFNDNGKLRIFIRDKEGNDFEYQESLFERTAKTVSASEDRQKRARLDFFWENKDTSFVINPSWHYNFDTTEFFELNNNCHFLGDGMEGVIGKISRHKKEKAEQGWRYLSVEGSTAYFKTKQDYYDYFKEIDVENFKINGMFYGPQTAIDHNYFMLSLPKFDQSILKLSKASNAVVDRLVHSSELTLNQFLKIASCVIFDEKEMSPDNKQIVYNIVEAYELLPNSHGPTSVSKMLMGKECKTIASVKHLSGTCTKLKQPQMFELCNIVESFMYVNKIFVRKDDYGNGEEWRGAYEFIGSKAINMDELNLMKALLK